MKLLEPDSLGVAGEGFHKHVGGIAIFDVAGTILAGYLLARYIETPPIETIAVLFIVGEVAHAYFKVPTTVTKALKLVE